MYFSKSLAIGLPLSRTDTKRDGSCPSVSNGVDPQTFYTLCKHFNVFFLVSRDWTLLNRTDKKRDGSCPSVSNGVDPPTFYTLCKHQCIFLRLSRSDFRSVEPTQRETGRVRPCPMESIRQHFTPSVNTSVYFPKSLAIGLPVSRTG